MDMRSVDVAIDGSAGSVAAARESTWHFLKALLPSPAPEGAETVVLVVSEPVTNALRHGGGACTLELTAHPDRIEVAVHDHSPHVPRMRTPDLNEGTGGLGWPMVNRLATATTVPRRASGGKTASAFLPPVDPGAPAPRRPGDRRVRRPAWRPWSITTADIAPLASHRGRSGPRW
ncbi:Histidine kinase-like ATPase domain-containing protein [Streptomyces sp. TLI_105]|nr:Histidine kinase-like ATPase domain-containing protein [Streptomyces sp. TLI_105]